MSTHLVFRDFIQHGTRLSASFGCFADPSIRSIYKSLLSVTSSAPFVTPYIGLDLWAGFDGCKKPRRIRTYVKEVSTILGDVGYWVEDDRYVWVRTDVAACWALWILRTFRTGIENEETYENYLSLRKAELTPVHALLLCQELAYSEKRDRFECNWSAAEHAPHLGMDWGTEYPSPVDLKQSLVELSAPHTIGTALQSTDWYTIMRRCEQLEFRYGSTDVDEDGWDFYECGITPHYLSSLSKKSAHKLLQYTK